MKPLYTIDNNKNTIWYQRFDKTWIGFIFGLSAPVITLGIVFLTTFNGYSYTEFIYFLSTMHIMTKLFSLCVLSNLAIFFLYIWGNLMSGARGVLAATLLIAMIVAFIQLL